MNKPIALTVVVFLALLLAPLVSNALNGIPILPKNEEGANDAYPPYPFFLPLISNRSGPVWNSPTPVPTPTDTPTPTPTNTPTNTPTPTPTNTPTHTPTPTPTATDEPYPYPIDG